MIFFLLDSGIQNPHNIVELIESLEEPKCQVCGHKSKIFASLEFAETRGEGHTVRPPNCCGAVGTETMGTTAQYVMPTEQGGHRKKAESLRVLSVLEKWQAADKEQKGKT